MTKKYDFALIKLESTWDEHEGNKGGFRLSWACKDMSPLGGGFGTITFYLDKEGKLNCDNEFMSEEFVKQANFRNYL